MGADEIEWLRFEQQGVLSWRQAVAELGEGKVRHLIASGRWQSVCRGVLLTHTSHSGQFSRDQQLWIAVLAAGRGALVGGVAAARAGGLRTFPDDRIDVLVPGTRRTADLRKRLPLGLPVVVVRRTDRLPGGHVQAARPARTTMPRAIVDAASWARTDEQARVLIAAACQQRLVLPDELLSTVDTLPRAPRRRLVIETAHDVAGGAQALSEVDLLRLCRRSRLPRPELQEKRVDADGRTRYLDAYWPEWRLHAEVDGAHHMDARHWEADLRRQNAVWLAGERILRFTAGQVRRRPDEVAAQLRAALAAAGWRNGAR